MKTTSKRLPPFVIAGLLGSLIAGIALSPVTAKEPDSKAADSKAADSKAANSKAASNEAFTDDQLEFFESRVRPLLAGKCFECHSAKSEKIQGGLRLDSRSRAIQGGDSGAAVEPGKPDESLLVSAIRWQDFEMPPRGKLKPAEVATLVKWVEMGAPWPTARVPDPAAPGQSPTDTAGRGYDWQKWRNEHWAFQPVGKPVPPVVEGDAWSRSEIDRFVLLSLRQADLYPARPADSRALARRIYFDLVGLPPTLTQVTQFIAAAEQDRDAAVRELVDRLLESPQYGERWGRHWLDVARYSDGYGGFLDSSVYSEAWRYRDWVVDALNADMPYDTFIRLQIAGDLLGSRDDAVATGLFALGPTYRSDGGDPDSVAQAKAETLSDRLDTLGRGILGLTIACARCHDHKFDPLPQQDYYSLAGVFNNSVEQETPLAPPEVVEAFQRHQQAIADVEKNIKTLQGKMQGDKRQLTDDEQNQLEAWQNELAELRKTAPPKYDFGHALRDTGSSDMHVAIRGNLRKAGELAPRRFPRILAGDDPPRFAEGSGRAQLAEAVVAADNPLTPRVLVNRVWMHHFGKALVRTPSNFGALGEPPTHPELLDWLTASFLESGQSLKSLHRMILLSSTYQMSSEFDERAFEVDGDNRQLWRFNPRRLEAEAWRDALLSVTGELDPTPGGPPTDRIDSTRRTLYFKVSRNGDVFATDEFLRLFDFPLMRATIDKRPNSIVPQQYLFLMNSPFMIERSKALVRRLDKVSGSDVERIEHLYEWLFQREPRPDEVEVGRAFIRDVAAANANPKLGPWDQYAQVLLSSDEFMYLR